MSLSEFPAAGTFDISYSRQAEEARNGTPAMAIERDLRDYLARADLQGHGRSLTLQQWQNLIDVLEQQLTTQLQQERHPYGFTGTVREDVAFLPRSRTMQIARGAAAEAITQSTLSDFAGETGAMVLGPDNQGCLPLRGKYNVRITRSGNVFLYLDTSLQTEADALLIDRTGNQLLIVDVTTDLQDRDAGKRYRDVLFQKALKEGAFDDVQSLTIRLNEHNGHSNSAPEPNMASVHIGSSLNSISRTALKLVQNRVRLTSVLRSSRPY